MCATNECIAPVNGRIIIRPNSQTQSPPPDVSCKHATMLHTQIRVHQWSDDVIVYAIFSSTRMLVFVAAACCAEVQRRVEGESWSARLTAHISKTAAECHSFTARSRRRTHCDRARTSYADQWNRSTRTIRVCTAASGGAKRRGRFRARVRRRCGCDAETTVALISVIHTTPIHILVCSYDRTMMVVRRQCSSGREWNATTGELMAH